MLNRNKRFPCNCCVCSGEIKGRERSSESRMELVEYVELISDNVLMKTKKMIELDSCVVFYAKENGDVVYG